MSTLDAATPITKQGRTLPITITIRPIAEVVIIGVSIGLPWVYANCFLTGLFGYSLLVTRAASLSPARAWWNSFAIGVVALGLAFHWAPNSIFGTTNLSYSLSVAVFVGLVLWEALAFAVIGWIASRAFHFHPSAIWAVVPAWLTIETHWPRVFNWATAHAYLGFPPLLQIAEFAGTSGVTACALIGSVALARWWTELGRSRATHEALAAVTFLLLVCVSGQVMVQNWRERIDRADKIRVAAVQVDPTNLDSLDEMRKKSDSVNGDVDLILWPESSLGNYQVDLQDFCDQDNVIQHCEPASAIFDPYPTIHCDLLAGGMTYDEGGRDQGPYKNTAFLINRDKWITGRYVKRSLMPIGEYVPGETWFPVLREWAAVSTELVRGDDDSPLSLSAGQRVGLLVCYEDMVADNAASSVLAGAQCLIALANGSAFKDPDTLEQHLRLAQFRAIENRRAMIRCAATGVTCLVQPDGSIHDRLSIGNDGVLVAEVPLEDQLTFYTRHGNWLSRLAACTTGLCGLIIFVRRSFTTNAGST